MKSPQIKVGDRDVFLSGSVISHRGEPITFMLPGGDGKTLKVICKFSGLEPENHKREITAISDLEAEIVFTNHNSHEGSANIDKIQFGALEGRQLFFSYRIFGMPKGTRVLNYTWSLGEEVQGG